METLHLTNNPKEDINARFPQELSRRERKKWLQYEKLLSKAFQKKNNEDLFEIKEKFISFVSSKGLKGCPLLFKVTTFSPTEALFKNLTIGTKVIEVWECP